MQFYSMPKIIYYVATSLDGYISGPDGDISGFVGEGSGLERYLEDLKGFSTVIMGRNTYEFGYRFGLDPGQPAYAHMDHYIISESLSFDTLHEKVRVIPPELTEIDRVRDASPTDVYLCGGGQLAGWLLRHGRLDVLKLKLNPLVLGGGVPLFAGVERQYGLTLLESEEFDHGLAMRTYSIRY